MQTERPVPAPLSAPSHGMGALVEPHAAIVEAADRGLDPSGAAEVGAALPAGDVGRRSGGRGLVRDFVESLVLAAGLFFGLQLVVQNTVVKGVSMMPNYVSDERVLVNRLAYRFGEPRRGDVIVFHAPGVQAEDFIKRIIALPGETVEIRRGQVYVDGRLLPEPYWPVRDTSSFGPFTVPAGQYFVLGDNRPSSNDSRTWAPGGRALERGRIVGPVWLSVWPPTRWGFARADGSGPAAAAGPVEP